MINQPTGLGWALWVVAAALPWLSPIHGEPWTAFYSEALAAAAMLPIALWAVLRMRDGWALDRVAAALLALALVPLAQALFGMYVFAGEAWLVALYLASTALVALVARRAEEQSPLRLADVLFASLAVAALLSAGLALYQWLELDGLSNIVHFGLRQGRAFANLGQPNNLATLLCWGLIAIWWAHARAKVGGPVAILAAAFLLLGVVLTRSRTGWLEVAMLAAAALVLRARHKTGPSVLVTALLCGWFTLLAVGLEPLAAQALRDAPAQLSDQGSAGLRPAIWKLALDEIAQRPWFGYGWNQSVLAHMGIAEHHPELRIIINHAHNAVLDLMVWNGIPLGLAIVGGLVLWSRAQWRACRSQQQQLLLLALALLLVHALLELPHSYLYFLLPAAVMVGTLNAMSRSPTIWAVPRSVVAVAVLVLGALLVLSVRDYQAIERDLLAARMRAAGIHNPNPAAPAEPIVLGFLQTALVRLRTAPTAELPAEQLADLRRTLDRYPTLGGLFRYAQSSALRGQPDEARWALERLCLLNTKRSCDTALREWRELAAQGHPAMNAVVLPTPR